MKGTVAQIALQGAIPAFDKLYTYIVPLDMKSKAVEGCRVIVPFGRGNTKKQGIILHINTDELRGLKSIYGLIDRKPVLTKELISLCEYMKESLFCSYYDAVNVMLPAGLSYKLIDFYSANSEFSAVSLLSETEKEIYSFLEKKGESSAEDIKKAFGVSSELLEGMISKDALFKSSDAKRKMGDATQKWARLKNDEYTHLKLTSKQKEVVSLLEKAGEASVKEICYFTGVTAAVIDNLIKKEVIIAFEKKIFRTACKAKASPLKDEIVLTDEQQKAFDSLMGEYNSSKGAVSLLYGVTGSGKTQVFLRLADEVIAKGRGVIVMVPEISLTPQLIDIFSKRYGDKIAVFHSAMSMGQRMDEWRRIRESRALIAIGTRSAVFAPFENLGLVIIDEEQEHTYKSEKTPRFHTRDLARYRVGWHKGLLCLASATPSVESFTAAKSGKYSLFRLTKRYGDAVLPEVETVDMKNEISSGNTGIISNRLYEALKATLEQGKQAILLLNRRGYNTYISCPKCGEVATCPNCSVSLTYHSANGRLMCHYCGYSQSADTACSQCGEKHMKFTGLGTQKAQEELMTLFPNASILRLDADSTLARDSFSNYLNDFAYGKYDILLGTQMVAKGLDFANVALVGVLGADSAMYSEDFRSFERTFSLLTQVVGRAGRGSTMGNAIIQTVSPDSNIISLAKKQDYDSFYQEEILTRRLMIYPPYCDICVVIAQSEYKDSAERAINQVFSNIKQLISGEYEAVKLIILGPAPATVVKVSNRYRYRMIIKCKNNTLFRQMLRRALELKNTGDTTVSVDINPESII